MRYAEEVELPLEEMRRVLAFLEWDGDQWKHTLHIHPSANSIIDSPTPSPAQGTTAALEEGLLAYTLRQGSVRQRLLNALPAFIALTN